MEETDSEEDSDEVEGAEGGGEDDEDDEEEEEDDDGGGECCVPGAWGSGPRLPRAHSLGLFPARASLLVTRGFKFLLNFS